jgi:hypothetical protein
MVCPYRLRALAEISGAGLVGIVIGGRRGGLKVRRPHAGGAPWIVQ